MFAISFDMVISNLKKHYGEPYNNAYFEIKEVLRRNGFNWVQGSTYLTESDDLGNVIKAIMDLSKIDWFKKSVRDIRGYKVENWSDFTDIVKNA
ncbi:MULTISPECIES: virulence protein [Bacteroides]|uniref:Endoribonuclease VapD n=1 Tax=Bacteroides faecium TaxID=2715212 RepID=A0A6H0KPG7_9BACE|nr:MULTISPECIES: virulence protein [Bacteroides]MCR2005023.1 virulence protein [Bacteroides acidifaciens]QIU95099.1 virulence protein [Bacteroides faecium]